MFDIGPGELLLVLVFPFSGFMAAIYLTLALRTNARRGQAHR
jgi:hypothetical protein